MLQFLGASHIIDPGKERRMEWRVMIGSPNKVDFRK